MKSVFFLLPPRDAWAIPVSGDQGWAAPGGLLYLLHNQNSWHLHLFTPLMYLYHTTWHPPQLLHLLQNATLQHNGNMQAEKEQNQIRERHQGQCLSAHRWDFSLLQLRNDWVSERHCKLWKQWMTILKRILFVTDLSSGPGLLLLLSCFCWRWKSSPRIPYVNIMMQS